MVRSRSSQTLALSVVLVAVVTGALLLAHRSSTSSRQIRARAAASRAQSASIGLPPAAVTSVPAVPPNVEPSSYQVVATFTANDGTPVTVYRGIHTGEGEPCFGLQTADVIGGACGPSVSGGGLSVERTSDLNHTYVAGLIGGGASSVTVTSSDRAERVVALKNGAFIVEDSGALEIAALDAQGRPVASEHVNAASPDAG
jgi:hypothetical protein